MADARRKYIIQQKLTDGMLTLWPETVGSQIIQETEYRLIGKNTILLGGTYSGPEGNPATLSTGAGNYSTTINSASTLSGNIVLTLPNRAGTIALTDDLPELGGYDGLLEGSYLNGEFKFEPYTVAGAGRLSWTATPVTGTTALSYSGYFNANRFNNLSLTESQYGFSISGGTVDRNSIILNDSASWQGNLTLNAWSDKSFTIYNNFTVGTSGTHTTPITLRADVAGTTRTLILGPNGVANQVAYFDANGALTGENQLLVSRGGTGVSTANANNVFAGPVSGGAAAPGFRTLVNADIPTTLSISDLTLSGDLAVNGGDITTTASTLNIGAATTDVIVKGNLIVQGDNFIANTSTVTTEDDIIQLRSSATLPMTGYAGLVATKYDGTHDGALVFDNSGTAWIGDVTIQPDGSIVDVSMQTIATRETTPNATAIPFWDATTSRFVTNSSLTFTNTGTILNIDNLRLDGNTISSTNTNGNITVAPNGSGTTNIQSITNITGLLNANGGIAVDTNRFTVQDATGNTFIAGTLEVDGTTQIDGILDVNNSVDVDAPFGFFDVDTQSISLDSTSTSNFNVIGANSTASNLILGAANSSTGTASVNITAKTGINLTAPTTTVTGAASVTGALSANSLNINNNFTVDSTGNAVGTTFNKVTITQPATGSTLTIANGKTLISHVGLTVGAAATNTGDITIRSNNSTARTLTLSADSTINALTSGHVLIAGAANTISSEAQLAASRGGTGIGSYALGDLIYASASTTLTKLAGNITTTKRFLSQTGNGSVSSAPVWSAIVNSDLPESPSVAADIAAYNAVNDPDVTEMTYTAVSVNSKGVVTAGAYVLEVGAPSQTAPSPELIFGGLFFKDVTVPTP
jgi:hypothetical protein